MKTLFLLLIHYILDSHASCSLSRPINATLVSNNFQHMLHWIPGKDTPSQTSYRVKQWKNGHAKWLAERPHRNHTIDVSRHMKDIYAHYFFQLYASLGNRSCVANITPSDFFPYKMTTIGPPSLDVLGCGDCLNITILLPKGEWIKKNISNIYYQSILFKLLWKKASGKIDQDTWHQISYQNATYAKFVHVLQNLQPQEEYCVKAQPKMNVNPNALSSGWICAFTSTPQAPYVSVIWCIVAVLVGLCFLCIMASLAYIGIPYKSKVTLPKALTGLVLGHYASLEEVCFSVPELDCSTRMNKLKYLLQPVEDGHPEENQEKSGSKVEEDEEGDEDSNMESYCAYMERVADSRDSCTTDNVHSLASTTIFPSECANNSVGYSFEDVPAQAKDTIFQLHVVGDDKQMSLLNPVRQELKPPKAKELEKQRNQIKEETERDALCNINLLSVTLKSMQVEEDMIEDMEICQPLLPVLLRDQQGDVTSLSKPQSGKPQLSTLVKVDRLTGQKELIVFSEVKSDCLDQTDEKDCSSDSSSLDSYSDYMRR